MTDTHTHVTTKLCGRRVAGRAVEAGKPGQKLQLTTDEAEYEIGQGTIVAGDGKLHDAFGKKTEKSEKLRAEIAQEVERHAAVRAGTSVDTPASAAEVEQADAEITAPVQAPPAIAPRVKPAAPAKAD